MKRIGLLFVMLACLLGSVSGLYTGTEVVKINEVPSYYYHIPNLTSPTYTIYQVNINDLDEGVTEISLDSYGEQFDIDINCTRGWGWWNFAIVVDTPDASPYSINLSTLQPFALDYDLKIQYIDSEIDWILDVDLYVDFNPVSAGFEIPVGGNYSQPREFDIFSSTWGTFSDTASVEIYLGTQDTLNDIEDRNPFSQFLRSIGKITEDIWIFTWEAIISFIYMIPFIGEYFGPLIEYFGAIIGELFWYFDFFIFQEPEIMFITVECFILGHVIINGRSYMGMLKLLYKDHIALINGIIAMGRVMLDVIIWVAEAIAAIVNAIKPI